MIIQTLREKENYKNMGANRDETLSKNYSED